MRAKTPARQEQQRRCNTGNNNNSTMLAMTPAQCRQNASAMLANASAAPARPSKANLATTPAQHWQQGQLNAGNDASAIRARTPSQRQKNAIAALARPSKAKSLRVDARYSNKATGYDNERNNNASLAMCCNCVMTGQMPVRDAGGNASVTRATTPVQQGQRCLCSKGNNAGTMPATRTEQCWQQRQRMLRLLCGWPDTSLQCWRQCKGDAATMPAQQGQRHLWDESNDAGATPATMTAQCWQ